jgi:LPS-assembly lipoprotein
MWNRRRLMVALASAAVLLAGCGFHLRGDSPLLGTMSRLSVEGLPLSPVRQALIARLEKSGVMIDEDADISVVLLEEDQEKRVSAYSSRAKSAAFELRRMISFRVTNRLDKDHPMVSDTEFSVRRQLLFRQDQVLGKIEEEARLIVEMEQELAERIVRKLETLTLGSSIDAVDGDAP